MLDFLGDLCRDLGCLVSLSEVRIHQEEYHSEGCECDYFVYSIHDICECIDPLRCVLLRIEEAHVVHLELIELLNGF